MLEPGQAALQYLEMGFSVIPFYFAEAGYKKKQPYLPWKEFQDRRPTEAEVNWWWRQWPGAQVGIVTGKVSGICVVDLDHYKMNEGQREKSEELIPETTMTPTVLSPNGGQHLYFLYPKKSTGDFPGFQNCPDFVDLRCDGNFIVAPPSCRPDKFGYDWILGLEITSLPMAEFPEKYFEYIVRTGVQRKFDPHQRTAPIPETRLAFSEPGRDETLFHVANCLVKGGMGEDNAIDVINRLASTTTGHNPLPKNIAQEKVKSAINRLLRKERDFQAEVEEWIQCTTGEWTIQTLLRELNARAKEETWAIRKAVERVEKSGKIARDSRRDGVYRTPEMNFEIMDLNSTQVKEFPIIFPLGIQKLVEIYPGNIVVVAGSKSAGKSAFMLNLIRENMGLNGRGKDDLIYMDSESGNIELKKRLSLFSELSVDQWKFIPIVRKQNWGDVVCQLSGPNKIFLIDYLEIVDNFYLIAREINAIHQHLKDGVAIVAIQKDPSKERELGRGGSFSLDKARLYLTLDRNRVSIYDAKAWRDHDKNPNGLCKRFKLLHGANFIEYSDWITKEEYDAVNWKDRDDRAREARLGREDGTY